eukprot:4666294-Ditylum_brightwellii.AAC.1
MIEVDNSAINTVIYSLCCGNENFEFAEQGSVQHYLGVKIIRSKNGCDNPVQCHLLHKDLEDNQRVNLSGYFNAGGWNKADKDNPENFMSRT